METKRLEVFIALVDSGGFSQAAKALYMTQPALSQQIARLEGEIGVTLIDRSTRPISVTVAGREFYFRARKVLDAMQGVNRMSADTRNLDFGRVRLGVVPAMLFGSMAGAIRSFRDAHPAVEVDIVNIRTVALLESLERGTLDVAVLLTEPDLKNLSSESLFSEEYLVCLPWGHPLADNEVVHFEQLKDETFIQGPRSANPAGFDAIVAASIGAGFSPKSRSAAGSFIDQAGMVAAGMGVSLLPASFEGFLPPGAVARRIAKPSVGMTVSMSWFESRLDTTGRQLVEHMRAWYGTRGPNPNLDWVQEQLQLAAADRNEMQATEPTTEKEID